MGNLYAQPQKLAIQQTHGCPGPIRTPGVQYASFLTHYTRAILMVKLVHLPAIRKTGHFHVARITEVSLGWVTVGVKIIRPVCLLLLYNWLRP